MGSMLGVASATLGALAMGCGAAASEPGAVGEPELDAGHWASEWRRLALPDPRISELGITSTPDGWLLVSSAGSAFSSYMYRSSDGVRWTRVPLPDDPVRLTGVAYGGGRYVVVGYGADGASHLIWVSTDGETWRAPPPVTGGYGLAGVQYAGQRFFGLGGEIWSSPDGESWVRSERDGFLGPSAVAFGAGRYLAVGIGAPQLSSDALSWSAAPIDCSLPTACLSDVDGGTPFNQLRGVFFAAGHFYVAKLRSPDGQNWDEVAGPVPTSYLSGRLLRRDFGGPPLAGTLEAWSEGSTPQPIDVLPAPEVELPSEGNIPESLDYSWSDGLDCTSARCVLLGKELYLIP